MHFEKKENLWHTSFVVVLLMPSLNAYISYIEFWVYQTTLIFPSVSVYLGFTLFTNSTKLITLNVADVFGSNLFRVIDMVVDFSCSQCHCPSIAAWGNSAFRRVRSVGLIVGTSQTFAEPKIWCWILGFGIAEFLTNFYADLQIRQQHTVAIPDDGFFIFPMEKHFTRILK